MSKAVKKKNNKQKEKDNVKNKPGLTSPYTSSQLLTLLGALTSSLKTHDARDMTTMSTSTKASTLLATLTSIQEHILKLHTLLPANTTSPYCPLHTSTKAERIIQLQSLSEWLYKEAPRCGIYSLFNFVAGEDESEGGNYVVATRPLPPSAQFLSLPASLMITSDIVLQTPFGQLLSQSPLAKQLPTHLLAIYILYEYQCGENSRWHPYLASLPTSFDLPIFCTPAELSLLCPTSIVAIANLQLSIYKQYIHYLTFFTQHNLTTTSSNPLCTPIKSSTFSFTLDEWMWAISICMTRQNQIPGPSGSAIVLIPAWDLCNHIHTPSIITTHLSSTDDVLYLTSHILPHTYVPAGSAIHIYYGRRNLSQWCIYSGFVPEDTAPSAFLTLLDWNRNDKEDWEKIKEVMWKKIRLSPNDILALPLPYPKNTKHNTNHTNIDQSEWKREQDKVRSEYKQAYQIWREDIDSFSKYEHLQPNRLSIINKEEKVEGEELGEEQAISTMEKMKAEIEEEESGGDSINPYDHILTFYRIAALKSKEESQSLLLSLTNNYTARLSSENDKAALKILMNHLKQNKQSRKLVIENSQQKSNSGQSSEERKRKDKREILLLKWVQREIELISKGELQVQEWIDFLET